MTHLNTPIQIDYGVFATFGVVGFINLISRQTVTDAFLKQLDAQDVSKLSIYTGYSLSATTIVIIALGYFNIDYINITAVIINVFTLYVVSVIPSDLARNTRKSESIFHSYLDIVKQMTQNPKLMTLQLLNTSIIVMLVPFPLVSYVVSTAYSKSTNIPILVLAGGVCLLDMVANFIVSKTRRVLKNSYLTTIPAMLSLAYILLSIRQEYAFLFLVYLAMYMNVTFLRRSIVYNTEASSVFRNQIFTLTNTFFLSAILLPPIGKFLKTLPIQVSMQAAGLFCLVLTVLASIAINTVYKHEPIPDSLELAK